MVADLIEIKKSSEKCPNCKAPALAPYTPFCSDRCGKIDLGRWFNEQYTIPTEEAPPSTSPSSDD